ncbi:MAG TPA: hypothetical protein VKU85_04385 [bacterium]|nr:hypothetical protein [bacterium]
MKEWLRARPWLWVVLLFLVVLAVNVFVVVLSGQVAPEPVTNSADFVPKNHYGRTIVTFSTASA